MGVWTENAKTKLNAALGFCEFSKAGFLFFLSFYRFWKNGQGCMVCGCKTSATRS
jgi:hypothetical protein